MSEMNSRRQFVKLALGVSGLALISPKIVLAAEERRRAGAAGAAAGGGSVPLVKPGEGMAVSMNYVEKKSDLKNASLKTERQGVSFDKQFCHNCMFYTADGKHDGADVGKCTVFNNQHVKSEGWCSSWAKKA